MHQLQQLPPTPSGAADAQKIQNAATIDRDLIRRVDALVLHARDAMTRSL